MGLGKTLQLICLIDVFLTFTKATKVLCIVPMNTIQNWYNEFNTWLPEEAATDDRTELDESSNASEDAVQNDRKSRKFKVLLFSDNVKTTAARSAIISKFIVRE